MGIRFAAALATLAVALVFSGCGNLKSPAEEVDHSDLYTSSERCKNCHGRIYDEYKRSMHSRSYSNPAFTEQYFNEVLERVRIEPRYKDEAGKCIACHNPVAFQKLKGPITDRDQRFPTMENVTCDFCHTITGYKGEAPGSANYITSPGETKYGPFRHEEKWHHQYHPLYRQSEYCGLCHDDTNAHGVSIKGTYTEWKNSEFAKKNIQCQDCHMNMYGYLMPGSKPFYEKGTAAHMTLGRGAPERRRLYSHAFPGAHTKSQLEGALTLKIHTEGFTLVRGKGTIITVEVDNSRAGHKMPTGSADLRLMWLEITARYEGQRETQIPASSLYQGALNGFDVSQGNGADSIVLGPTAPEGSRIYRAVFLDQIGKPTLSSYEARKIEFDNRLGPGEVRAEQYRFMVPREASGKLTIKARLLYVPYTDAFADQVRIKPPEPVLIAKRSRTVDLR